MSRDSWLVIGISGGTCSGKSTLARAIFEHLSAQQIGDHQVGERRKLGSIKLIKQDDYFFKRDRPEHTWIPGWNYINREIITALEMNRMCADIDEILGGTSESSTSTINQLNVLIIEGFLIFNDSVVRELCQLRFNVHIGYDLCFDRRKTRTYNPPNPPGYFEQFIWPLYLKHLAEYKDLDGLVTLDGSLPAEHILDVALYRIRRWLEKER